MKLLLLGLTALLLLLSGCNASQSPSPLPRPPAQATPAPSSPGLTSADAAPLVQTAVAGGIGFLHGQYHPAQGLLQESPRLGQRRYYVANDNLLAWRALQRLDALAGTPALTKTLEIYQTQGNGFVEVAWGEVVPWPPPHHRDVVMAAPAPGRCDLLGDGLGEDDGNPITQTITQTQGGLPLVACVLTETHPTTGGYFYDWSAFSNLACMAAVNEWNGGYRESATRLLQMQMTRFDGSGWQDEAYQRRVGSGAAPDKTLGVYETLGLAWCLYAAALTQTPVDARLLFSLLAQQNPENGGFHTHFQYAFPAQADANVETTSVTLLALDALAKQAVPLRLEPAQQAAVAYLLAQYNDRLGLLRESPVTAPERHWLATDNQLAAWALAAAGQAQMARRLQGRIDRLGEGAGARHGLIEALTGAAIVWPPHVETQREIAPGIWQESRSTGPVYADWQTYADLALYAALESFNRGEAEQAQAVYSQALAQFDGTGFADKAFAVDGFYATYKLALALLVGARLQQPPDPLLLQALLTKQTPTGGFTALYTGAGQPVGDSNTETTAYALLALAALGGSAE